jgi:hypothetical protein
LPDAAQLLHISDKTLVLPKPRSASGSQTDQAPSGGSWLGRTLTIQPPVSSAARRSAKVLR